MYYVNKIVGWVLSPLGLLFLGLACAWFLRSCKTLGRIVAGGTLLFLWLLGLPLTTRVVGLPLEVDEISLEALPSADAIVLLGGGMGCHVKCRRAEMFGAADRVWTAARLWKLGKAPKMTLSGSDVQASTVPLLKDLGVDEAALLQFPEARNTEEESKMIRAAGVRKILLVTSAWHMPRAKMLFERRGFEVVPAPADYEMHFVAENPIGVDDFFPCADALARNSYAVKEWVARLGYSIVRR